MHKQDIAPIELKTIWDTRIRSWLQNNVLYDEKAAKAHQKYNTKQLHRVFLSSFHFIVSSPYLKFLPSQSVKNQTHHSVLHAGRYLYDKEIRYLGTVIVTAGLCRELQKSSGQTSEHISQHQLVILCSWQTVVRLKTTNNRREAYLQQVLDE